MALVDSDAQVRAISSSGRVVFRGGQTLDSSLFDSVLASLSLLAYHPIGFFMLLIGLFIFLADFHTTMGPLEIFALEVINISNSPEFPVILRSVSTLLLFVLNILIKYKIFVGKFCLVWFTYIVKPSGRHLCVAVLLSFVVLMKELTYFELIFVSLIFYFYATFRSPGYKLFFAILLVCVLVTGLVFFHSIYTSAHITYLRLTLRPGRANNSASVLQPSSSYDYDYDYFANMSMPVIQRTSSVISVNSSNATIIP